MNRSQKDAIAREIGKSVLSKNLLLMTIASAYKKNQSDGGRGGLSDVLRIISSIAIGHGISKEEIERACLGIESTDHPSKNVIDAVAELCSKQHLYIEEGTEKIIVHYKSEETIQKQNKARTEQKKKEKMKEGIEDAIEYVRKLLKRSPGDEVLIETLMKLQADSGMGFNVILRAFMLARSEIQNVDTAFTSSIHELNYYCTIARRYLQDANQQIISRKQAYESLKNVDLSRHKHPLRKPMKRISEKNASQSILKQIEDDKKRDTEFIKSFFDEEALEIGSLK